MTADDFKKWYRKWWKRVPKPIRWVINRLDDPFDWCKEWLYNEGEGRVIWKWRIIFDCIMMNRDGGCRIERI
jgi:hypothetical protein